MTHGAATDAGEVADRVERDLRVVGAGLDAEVAAATLRVELIAPERGQVVAAAGRLRSARPKRSVEERSGPKPNVSVSRDGGRPTASPVSIGGAIWASLPVADRLLRCVIAAAAAVQVREQIAQVARSRS